MGMQMVLDPGTELTLGRGVDCGIVVVDPCASRIHARICRRSDEWWLCDDGSQNGTFLNGRKIDEAPLTDGCRFCIGEVEFQFAEPGDSSADSSPEGLTQVLMAEKAMHPGEGVDFAPEVLRDPELVQDCLTLLEAHLSGEI